MLDGGLHQSASGVILPGNNRENMMVELKRKEQFPMAENWQLEVHRKGTVRLGEYKKLWTPEMAFNGREIIQSESPVDIIRGENLIVTVGKAHVGDRMIDAAGIDYGFTYCAEGTDNTAPAVAQTTLVAEAARKIMTSRLRTTIGAVVYITCSTFFTAAEANDSVLEAGIFGDDASAAVNSGTMFSRWLVTFDNTGIGYDLTFSYKLSFS